jgi:hypothetical protein
MAVKTIITVVSYSNVLDTDYVFYTQMTEVPITYHLSKDEAITEFYRSGDHNIGRIIKVEEVQYKTTWEKIIDFIRRRIKQNR